MESKQLYQKFDMLFERVIEIYRLTTLDTFTNPVINETLKVKSRIFLMKFIKLTKKYGVDKEYNAELLLKDLEEIF